MIGAREQSSGSVRGEGGRISGGQAGVAAAAAGFGAESLDDVSRSGGVAWAAGGKTEVLGAVSRGNGWIFAMFWGISPSSGLVVRASESLAFL